MSLTVMIAVGITSTPFRIRLEPNDKLQIQKVTKIQIQNREKLDKLHDELGRHNNFRQNGSTPSDTSFLEVHFYIHSI